MIEKIDGVVNAISGVLYKPYIVPLLLVLAGLYFTIRTGLIQFKLFGESIRVVSEKPKEKDGISSFRALMVSTASRVGTGNIIGVSAAIIMGGFGAIFWMWITAILGGASAFVESTLAQIYKKRDEDGTYYGGPSYYMQDALKQRWLGVIFAIILILTYAVGYNMLASYNTQSTFEAFSFYQTAPMLKIFGYKVSLVSVIIGAILAVLFGVVVLGGAKRLTNVTGVLVPIMGILYVIVSLVILVINIKYIPAMFAAIFKSAFDFKAIFGGFTGSCIMWGIKRGLYSNEAGMGSAPNAAATADVSHPAKQGLVQMLSVFIDTLLICTATAFMCMSGQLKVGTTDLSAYVDATGNPISGLFVQDSIFASLGNIGPIFIATALCLFAFTTLIGNYYYCEGCLKFILKRTPSKAFITCFRLVATVLVFLGAVLSAGLVWDTADMLQGLMVVINVPVIIILGKPAIDALKDYLKQRKEGKDPHFKAADIGVDNTECWN